MIEEKRLEDVTEEDLKILLDNSVSESKTLEYKETLPGGSDSDKKEFLADVSSFANTLGGDLLYGISDNGNGEPEEILGLDIRENEDETIRRLEQLLRSSIEPKISFKNIHSVKLSNGKCVLIIRVRKSWNSPHRVSFKNHNKFYLRGDKEKYEMDVADLRSAFNLSSTIEERIKEFRTDRISKILTNETPVPIHEGAKVILHLIPLSAFSTREKYDMIKKHAILEKLSPMHPHITSWHFFNLDGYVTDSSRDTNEFKSYAYTQFFRNGIIEGVEGFYLRVRPNGEKGIPSEAVESGLIISIQNYLSFMKEIGINTPIFIFITIVDVKDYRMLYRNDFTIDRSRGIDRDILSIPEILVEDFDTDVFHLLKPSFDMIWNSCGLPESLNYKNLKWDNKNNRWPD